MGQEYYVAMSVAGQSGGVGAVKNGNLTECRKTVKRLMSQKGRSEDISWHIYQCVGLNFSLESERYIE